jgi:DNA-binding transcriptional ArsR family regulator
MRPLLHPPIEAVTVEGILHALAEPVRVAIYAQIAGSGCAQICSDFMHMPEREVPKSTLSQHFKVLREAGLIRSVRQGVEMKNTTRCAELEQRFPGLVPSILKAHKTQLGSSSRPAARRRVSGRSAAAK